MLQPVHSIAQNIEISGRVVDYSNKHPIEAVSVMSTSGRGTITDSLGRYKITVSQSDSIWFSYINKKTQKYPIDTIKNITDFDIALHVDIAWLPTVTVRNSNYKLDSLLNREMYGKYFNFRKPTLKLSTTPPSAYVPGSMTAGFDLAELINVFRFKRTKSLSDFQERLLRQEQDKYIDHRFSKRFVKQVTKADSTELDQFMIEYKPDYYELLQMNDLELGYFIQKCYKEFLDKRRNKTEYTPLNF